MSRCRVLAVGLLACGLVSVPVAPAAAAKRVFGKRPLHQGMRGRDVRVLQDYLTRAGFKTAVDGQFGPGTARKVRAWETQESRKVDGRVSRPDAKALRITVESSSRKPLAAPATGSCFKTKKICFSGTPSGRTPLYVQPGASIVTRRGLS